MLGSLKWHVVISKAKNLTQEKIKYIKKNQFGIWEHKYCNAKKYFHKGIISKKVPSRILVIFRNTGNSGKIRDAEQASKISTKEVCNSFKFQIYFNAYLLPKASFSWSF